MTEKEDAPPKGPKKTPMYEAINAARYQRQALIRTLNAKHSTRMICYVSGPSGQISRDDILGFGEVLHNIPKNSSIDLLLHTPGGDLDAAEKLINVVHARVRTGVLRVIVPDFAKSAGTLMALGAETIFMSDTSELGPIDPQLFLDDGKGNQIPHSVSCFLDAYSVHAEALRKDPSDPVARLMLDKLDPAMLKKIEVLKDRARACAEDQLRQWMFHKKPGNSSKIASELLDTTKWQSHGQMIGWQAAQTMGLSVEYLEPDSEDWQAYWSLYCQQRYAIRDGERLFESDYASHVI